MSKQTEALKLALEALEYISSHYMSLPKIGCMALAAVEEALAAQKTCLVANEPCKHGSWCSEVYCQEHCKFIEQPAQQQEQKLEFVSPGGGYVPAIPRPIPLDWKLVPRKATPEMLRAMDECAQEGYDERLYEGMASSVYMAAWDASPVMGTLPEQPAQQQEPVATLDDIQQEIYENTREFVSLNVMEWMLKRYYTPPASKPWVGLTQQDINIAFDDTQEGGGFDDFARAIETKLREKNAPQQSKEDA